MATSKILLGITGSIAAYKAADLASKLTQLGYVVSTVLTESASHFVGAATFGGVTQNPVYGSPYSSDAAQILHIKLAEESDAIVIAPATANILAKLAQGFADDLLSSVVLATTKPVIVVPAMNPNMYQHPATQENIKILKQRGVLIINPETGRMACNVEGIGRYPDNSVIIETVDTVLNKKKTKILNPIPFRAKKS